MCAGCSKWYPPLARTCKGVWHELTPHTMCFGGIGSVKSKVPSIANLMNQLKWMKTFWLWNWTDGSSQWRWDVFILNRIYGCIPVRAPVAQFLRLDVLHIGFKISWTMKPRACDDWSKWLGSVLYLCTSGTLSSVTNQLVDWGCFKCGTPQL